MAITTVSSKGQVVIPRALREKYRLASGTRLEVSESDEGLVLAPLKRARASRRQAAWRTLRGSAKGTNALKAHVGEPGAAVVQHWLDEAEAGRAECVTSVINLAEAYYSLVRVDRREEAESLWRPAVRGALPVSVKDATRRRVRRAAEPKSKHAIAYADAFAVATAVEFNAILLTGDPEIEPLEGEQNLKVQRLSRKR